VGGVDAVGLGTWRPPRDSVELRVPDVPPGRYLIALFDGSEGGTHYTWDHLTVLGGDADAGGLDPALAIAAGLLLLAGAGAFALRRSRRI
jgi:LPXTG-motif cell wall-anchored protein